MEAFETFEHAGFTCELHQDSEPTSPADWDQLGTMHSFESRNALGGFEDCDGDAVEAWERDRPGLTVRYLRSQGIIAVLFQFQDYGSSGARLLALDDDDDGIATGYIGTTVERIRELCGEPQLESDPFYCPRTWPEGTPAGHRNWTGTAQEWIVKQLQGELRTWDQWVQGEVVGYVVEDAAGELVDSCWGFYPDDEGDGLEYVRQEAREAAESERDSRAERRRVTVRGWAQAHGLGVPS